MIDSHAHLDFSQFDSDRNIVIHKAFESGIKAIVNIGTDLATSISTVELASRYENIYASIGVHPHDSQNCPNDYIQQIEKMAAEAAGKKIVAIGEIGLDYYRDLSPRDIQRKVFREQIDLALKLKLPIVAHIREAMDDALKILEESGIKRGVLHSFPGNIDEAAQAINMGFHISFAGPITYPKSTRASVAASIPLSRILTETDCPYLSPQVSRGKRNSPDNVRFVVEKLAELFSPYTFDDIDRITSLNAQKLFGFSLEAVPKIIYKIRRSLYINLTNRCSCNCYFCPRIGKGRGYVAGHYLLLKKEPTIKEVLDAIKNEHDFNEVVFCGLGEPTIRLAEMLEIASKLKKAGHFVRLDTNGHGSLINKIDIVPKLKGLIDKVSVSLNAADADTYIKLNKPDRGEEAYHALLKFIKDCVANGISADASVVELPQVNLDDCRKLAGQLGAGFRIRKYSKGDN